MTAAPAHWAATDLAEITRSIANHRPDDRPEEDFVYIDISSIDDVNRITEPKQLSGRDAPSRARQLVEAGDTVLSTVRTYLKNTALVPDSLLGAIASTGFCVLRPAAGVHPQFIFYRVLDQTFVDELSGLQTGTSYPAVRDSDVRAMSISLPPTAEQRRIVAAIDSYFTRLDAARAALERVQANLKRYRASVLKAAVGGKLVPTEAELARKEGRDYEPADQLLERILAERRARWESQEKRRGTYKKPVSADISGLSELPEGWVWCSVAQLAHVGTGSTPLTSKQQFYQNGTLPWITSSALNKPSITSPSSFVTEQAVREYRLLFYPPHTLLVAMYGEGRTRGKCSELLIRSTINQAIAAITMEGSASDCRQYARVFLNNNYEETRRLSSGGVQPNLNLGLVGQITAPLPPLAEQRCIVAEVERRLSVIQQAEATVEANLVRAERLRQSILKQAFSGRLVPRDPSDEPATVLLERIRLEREASHADAKASRQPRPRRTKPISARQLMPRKGNP